MTYVASPAGRRLQFRYRRHRRRIRRQRFRWRHGRRRSWLGRRRIFWHGTLAKESLLLQRFAVNLINANKAAYKIPVLLIRESAIVCRPGKLARQLCMIWIVYEIAINPGIRRRRFQLINQNRVIDGESGISCKKCDEQLAARQRRI